MKRSVTETLISRIIAVTRAVAVLVLWAGAAAAQGLYSPVIRVNDKAITPYEIEQRFLMLQALNAPGNLEEEARSRLIDERLQLQAAELLGISLTEDGLQSGIEEFAERANTDAENFLATLSSRGVAPETFADFVEAGLLWREVVRVRFAARAQVTEEDVDRAIALAGQEGGARVLVSEIILPARTPEETAAAEIRATEVSQIEGFEAFATAARNFSASSSRAQGGRIDWIPLNNLPPPLRAQFLTLPPGGVTEPLRINDAIAVFQLRALEEVPTAGPEIISVEYATYLMPGAQQSDLDSVAGRLDTCDDLYGVAYNSPPEYLEREVLTPAEIPADIARELEGMDENEISTRMVRGTVPMLVMLCGRTNAAGAELDRAEIRDRLRNQRIAAYAEAYLAELRADAVIVELE